MVRRHCMRKRFNRIQITNGLVGLWFGCMAGKAINFNRRIGMAAFTELPFRVNAYRVAAGILLCMAINTIDQTKGLTANAFNDRFIALMIQQ